MPKENNLEKKESLPEVKEVVKAKEYNLSWPSKSDNNLKELAELYKKAKPEDIVRIQTPDHDLDGLLPGENNPHYTKSEIQKLINSTGFEIVEIKTDSKKALNLVISKRI